MSVATLGDRAVNRSAVDQLDVSPGSRVAGGIVRITAAAAGTGRHVPDSPTQRVRDTVARLTVVVTVGRRGSSFGHAIHIRRIGARAVVSSRVILIAPCRPRAAQQPADGGRVDAGRRVAIVAPLATPLPSLCR